MKPEIAPLYATNTVSGPHSPEQLAALLRLAGMTAASWMAERLILDRDEARQTLIDAQAKRAADLETAEAENYDAGKLDGIAEQRARQRAHIAKALRFLDDNCMADGVAVLEQLTEGLK